MADQNANECSNNDTKTIPGRTKVYKVFPTSSILIYDGVTVLHYLLGGLGILMAYSFALLAYFFSAFYVAFAFVQMYLMMPLVVCPNCVYYRMKHARCVSGLNRFSQKIAKEGNLDDFANRAKGVCSHNKLYMASLFAPIIAIIPGLIISFSFVVLGILLAVVGLLLFRFFVIFPKIACLHCMAKKRCPNAIAMGVDKL